MGLVHSMQVRIHRRAREIGGTCVELAHDGARILLDLGLPLDGEPDDVSCYPSVDGMAGGGDLKALILSHDHPDHVGLAHLAGPDLPVVMGAATQAILTAAAPFVLDAYLPPSTDQVCIPMGPSKSAAGRGQQDPGGPPRSGRSASDPTTPYEQPYTIPRSGRS